MEIIYITYLNLLSKPESFKVPNIDFYLFSPDKSRDHSKKSLL